MKSKKEKLRDKTRIETKFFGEIEFNASISTNCQGWS